MHPASKRHIFNGPRTPPLVARRSAPQVNINVLNDNINNATTQVLVRKLRHANYMIIPTITTGDCLFAAVAMALKNTSLSETDQKRVAYKLRLRVANYMRKPAFEATWERMKHEVKPSSEDERRFIEIVRNMESVHAKNVYKELWQKAKKYKDRFAYASVMELPGMWAGDIEIHALAALLERTILVVTMPKNTTYSTPLGGLDYHLDVSYAAGLRFSRDHTRRPLVIRYIPDIHFEAMVDIHGPDKYGLLQRYKQNRRFNMMDARYAKIKAMKASLKEMGIPRNRIISYARHAITRNNFNNRRVNQLLQRFNYTT